MADNIHVKLPDGSVKEVPKGTTALDVAKSIGTRSDAALAAKTISSSHVIGFGKDLSNPCFKVSLYD